MPNVRRADEEPRKLVIVFAPLRNTIREGKGERHVRRKRNLFRDVNERISTVADRSLAESKIGFVCECSDRSCVEKVYLALMEYESLRGQPDHFVIAPGHNAAPYQRMIEENDRFALVKGRRSRKATDTLQLAS